MVMLTLTLFLHIPIKSHPQGANILASVTVLATLRLGTRLETKGYLDQNAYSAKFHFRFSSLILSSSLFPVFSPSLLPSPCCLILFPLPPVLSFFFLLLFRSLLCTSGASAGVVTGFWRASENMYKKKGSGHVNVPRDTGFSHMSFEMQAST